MATPTTIQNRSFIAVQGSGAVAPNFDSPIQLTCLDDQGNTIKKTIIEVYAITGQVDITLPEIASLSNDLNCVVDVIIRDNTNMINIICGGSDVIGQNAFLSIGGGTYSSGAVLTIAPAYEGYWSLNETIN